MCLFSILRASLAHYLFISWEFPGHQFKNCKSVPSPDDTANFLTFLQTLRKQKGAKHLILSASVALKPFIGADGNPVHDVSGFAKELNYIGSSPVSPFPNLKRRFLMSTV